MVAGWSVGWLVADPSFHLSKCKAGAWGSEHKCVFLALLSYVEILQTPTQCNRRFVTLWRIIFYIEHEGTTEHNNITNTLLQHKKKICCRLAMVSSIVFYVCPSNRLTICLNTFAIIKNVLCWFFAQVSLYWVLFFFDAVQQINSCRAYVPLTESASGKFMKKCVGKLHNCSITHVSILCMVNWNSDLL